MLTLDSGEVVILELGKSLWFRNRMEKSLINPNQFQKFVIQICNDSTEPHRNLVIEASESLFKPMTMDGSTCGIIKYPTTDDEIRDCQLILLTY